MELEEYKQQLRKHDWYYYYSDDHGVWSRGESEANRMRSIANQSDDHKRAYNAEHAAHFNRTDFTGEDNAHPYAWAFPSVESSAPPQPSSV